VTGSGDQIAKAGISIADIAAGVTAYHSILAALIHRGKTGRGDHIEVSMLEAMAEWMAFPCISPSMAPIRRRGKAPATRPSTLWAVRHRRRRCVLRPAERSRVDSVCASRAAAPRILRRMHASRAMPAAPSIAKSLSLSSQALLSALATEGRHCTS